MKKTSPPPTATDASINDKGQLSAIPGSVAKASPENAIDTFEVTAQNSVALIVGTIAAVLALMAIPVVGIGALALITLFTAILAAAIPTLWPATTAETIWKSLSNYAETLIKSHIEAVVINDATAEARILVLKIDTVHSNLQFWIKSGKTEGVGILTNSILSILNNYVPEMEKLIRQQYQGILLPQYVQAAFYYLVALRTIYPFADELNLSARANLTGKILVLSKLRSAIEAFTNQAIVSYTFGLQQIVDRPGSTWYGLPPA